MLWYPGSNITVTSYPSTVNTTDIFCAPRAIHPGPHAYSSLGTNRLSCPAGLPVFDVRTRTASLTSSIQAPCTLLAPPHCLTCARCMQT